jgi:hypothetical protein
MSKSLTDSELIGLTDNLDLVDLFHEFLSFIAGSTVEVPVVYQDSTSGASLVTEGGGITCTKHLRVWMNLCKEHLAKQCLMVCYTIMKDMAADGLSKPTEGEDFQQFTAVVQGEAEV